MNPQLPKLQPKLPASAPVERSVTLLGATGSIGASTIDLIKREPGRYRVEAVTANKSAAALAALARELNARFAAVGDPAAYRELKDALAGTGIAVGAGEDALIEAAQRPAEWVSVGITHDTAEFAVQSIRTWLDRIGRPRYTSMRELMITADCGGAKQRRSRPWEGELQKITDEIALPIKVCHYPPGTSKWNKIEHRLFCHITQNWRAKPLVSRAAVVELIAATTTKTGLKVECALDERTYEKGIKITDAEIEALDIRGDAFHPEWNYTFHPRPKKL